jgi:fructokinase
MTLLGAVELGGTKIRMARGTIDEGLVETETFATGSPEDAVAKMIGYFRAGPRIGALGIGSFGPIGLRPANADYGRFKNTPKTGWSGFDLIQALAALETPTRLETDVAAAALGEHRLGALRGIGHGLYLTIGTGIGGALLIDSEVINGAAHAEMGHLPLQRAAGDQAISVCPYHSSCAEGLASGPAVMRRFGRTLSDAGTSTQDIRLIGGYLGQLAASLVLTLAPERIVMGGGVAKAPMLLPVVQEQMLASLNAYGQYPALSRPDFLTRPELGDDAGLLGAIQLASAATTGDRQSRS